MQEPQTYDTAISAANLTEPQRIALRTLVEHGSISGAARALGISRASVQHSIRFARKKAPELVAQIFDDAVKANRQGDNARFDLLHPVPDGLTLKGTSIRYDDSGAISQFWNKTRVEGRAPEDAVQIVDPKKITKVSTLYDQEGRVTQQWVSEKPQDIAREQMWKEAAVALAESLPHEQPVPEPGYGLSDLLTVYPVGDHHFGMYAWGQETGGDSHDIRKSEAMLIGAARYLVNAAPASTQAAILVLGDFLHYDGATPVTPSHGHVLDADSRYPKIVRTAIRSLRILIKEALTKHQTVRLIIEIGNHDLSSAVFLMEAFAHIYEEETRVTVDTSPRRFHCFEFGKVMIGTHHGDTVKMQQLPQLFATDFPKMWGNTEHRYIHTGHVHHDSQYGRKDMTGALVESHRILPPADAYAANNGYRSPQSMKAIVYHVEHGEMARFTCTPQMLA